MTTARRPPRATRYVAFGILGLLVVLIVVLSAPSRADSEGPNGTAAFQRLVREMGMQVREGADQPPASAGTFVLLADFRSSEKARSLLAWVRAGGRLVLADPNSRVAERLGVRAGGLYTGFRLHATLEGDCPVQEAAGVRRLVVSVFDFPLSTSRSTSVQCFAADEGAFELSFTYGGGTVAVLAGRSPLTNALLDDGDNARFAVQLVRGGGPVVFGTPGLPPPRNGGVWAVLPQAARVVIVGLGVAALAFALVRGRRLGYPVLEDPLSPIPAGELVRAESSLLRRSGQPGFAGRLLRNATSRRLGRRLGLPASAPDLVQRVAEATGLPADRVRRLLDGPEPRSDDELIALGRELDEIGRRIEGAFAPR